MAGQAAFASVLWGVPVLAPTIKSHYGLSLPQVGYVLAGASYGMTFMLLPWGWLADRLGERRVIAIGLAGAALALVAAAFSHSVWALVGALALAGGSGAAVIPASGRAVMGWFAPEQRGLALGIRQTGVPLGSALAALSLPAIDRTGGLTAAFLALAAVSTGGAAATAAWLRRAEHGAGHDAPPAASPGGRPLQDRRIWRMTLSGALLFPAQSCMLGFVVVFLHQNRAVATGAAGIVLAAIQVLGGGLRIAAGRWSDSVGTRVGPLRILAWTMAVALAVLAASTHAPLVVLVPAIVLAGSVSISWNGLVYTATAEVAGRRHSGTALGLQQTGLAIAGAAAPIAISGIVASSTWAAGFAAVALCPLGALALLTGTVRRI